MKIVLITFLITYQPFHDNLNSCFILVQILLLDNRKMLLLDNRTSEILVNLLSAK